MSRFVVAAVIGLYQRFVSPHKGFCCAYRYLTDRHSCSEFGKQAVLKHGLIVGWILLRRRFARCKDAWLQLESANHRRRKRRSRWCDHCDLPCHVAPALPCDCSL